MESKRKTIESLDEVKDKIGTYVFEFLGIALQNLKEDLNKFIEEYHIVHNQGDQLLAKLTDIHIHCTSQSDGGYIRIEAQTICGKTARLLVEDSDEMSFEEKEDIEKEKYENAHFNKRFNENTEVGGLLHKINNKIKSNENLKKDEFSERELKTYLIKNLHLIEEGMELIHRQYKIENGYIDILAKDKNGVKCIIELKVKNNDKSVVFQSTYYPTQFKERVRMITICPNYTKRIKESLINLNYVEILKYDFDENDKLVIINTFN